MGECPLQGRGLPVSEGQRTHRRKPRQNGAFGMARDGIGCEADASGVAAGRVRPASTADTRIFWPAKIPPEMGTHVHQMTSDDVVTRLNAAESCH
jgi:hypothetical protein